MKTNNYGAVIKHIEPKHLDSIKIPEPDRMIRVHIANLIQSAVDKIDQSNSLVDQAESILLKSLELPSFEEFSDKNISRGVLHYEAKLSELNQRFEASYHHPTYYEIINHLKAQNVDLISLGDSELIDRIYLPFRFKRVYVLEGQGVPFLSGKHIGELDPVGKKYISRGAHRQRIEDELTVKRNMVVVTCSGSTGNVALIPEHWDGWVMTHDLIRVVPKSEISAGFLFSWLNSRFGRFLINRNNYGAVVDHIDDSHLASIPIPIPKDLSIIKKVGLMIQQSNELRFSAYNDESNAISYLEEFVLGQ